MQEPPHLNHTGPPPGPFPIRTDGVLVEKGPGGGPLRLYAVSIPRLPPRFGHSHALYRPFSDIGATGGNGARSASALDAVLHVRVVVEEAVVVAIGARMVDVVLLHDGLLSPVLHC